MNLSIEKVEIDLRKSFKAEHVTVPFFKVPFHYHPEIEIVLFLKGDGKMFIKDTMTSFNEGDLFIIGSNVPHLPLSHPRFKNENSNEHIEYILIQCDQACFEEYLLKLPELTYINTFLKSSKHGILVSNFQKTNLFEPFKKLIESNPLEQLISFISILESIRVNCSHKLIDLSKNKIEIKIVDERMKRVHKFLLQNYNKEISLKEVSQIANMNKTSFCRYFKSQTGKTFSHFINDLKIHYSQKLLIEGSYNINRIAYEIGYNNPTYFIKRFTLKNGISPKKYRKLHRI